MGSSAEQALMIGVNIFILIIALTGAIMLMTTVLDMSEIASSIIKTSDSSLMTQYGETNERIYTGEQVLAVINAHFSSTLNSNSKVEFRIRNGEQVLPVTNTEFTLNRLNSNYYLKYEGTDDNKTIYTFERIIENI